MKTIIYTVLVTTVLLSMSCSTQQNENSNESSFKVVMASEVDWTYLNPQRGDKAPMAGTLWGNRNENEATGFLLKPNDGFESPPHIHNVSYRGIVIQGEIHNDDPNAENMWMPTGSFWTQPKGEVHITAAKGANTLAYIEIEEGPYLVHAADEAFDSGERPVNVDKTNIVWVDAESIAWVKQSANSDARNTTEVAFLWGNTAKGSLTGTLLKLPAGYTGELHTEASTFDAVVIKGFVKYQLPNEAGLKDLVPGSYFGSEGKFVHHISSEANKETLIYIRSSGKYSVSSGE